MVSPVGISPSGSSVTTKGSWRCKKCLKCKTRYRIQPSRRFWRITIPALSAPIQSCRQYHQLQANWKTTGGPAGLKLERGIRSIDLKPASLVIARPYSAAVCYLSQAMISKTVYFSKTSEVKYREQYHATQIHIQPFGLAAGARWGLGLYLLYKLCRRSWILPAAEAG